MSWLGKLAKSLFIFLFFSYLQLQDGARESIMWLCHNVTICVKDGHTGSHHKSQSQGHMTRVTWGPWENKRIATVVKCISSRELSENLIEFSLLNSEQSDSWLNSGHQGLDANRKDFTNKPAKWRMKEPDKFEGNPDEVRAWCQRMMLFFQSNDISKE